MSNPAETYESYMVPALFAPAASILIQRADPKRGERVLDVATGTGIVARHAARRVGPNGAVVGLDLNPNMLAVARTAGNAEGLAIEWREGQAEMLPFEDGRFDLVLCQFALMFFGNRRDALAEMHRVLKNTGRVALSVFQGIAHHPFYQMLDGVFQRRFGMSGVGDIFALGSAGELDSMLTGAGFQQVESEPVSLTARFPDPQGFLAGEIAVDAAAIPSMQHLDDEARQRIIREISQEMEGPMRTVTEGDYVVLPFQIYVVRAR